MKDGVRKVKMYGELCFQIGFIHRDIKPANMAIGRIGSPEYRFIHILDFGLAREFVVHGGEGKLKMRRPRQRALFRVNINIHVTMRNYNAKLPSVAWVECTKFP
ncbi:hypothetical protein COOONC_13405 [Cooperia oncophora]